MIGRVPFSFPITVPQGEDHQYRQELDRNGRLVRAVVFFPRGTRTDLELTLVAEGEPINESEATDNSEDIADYLIGSGTTYRLDLGVDMFEGQTIGVDANNVSASSDLDAFVAYSIDFQEGR